MKKLYTTLFVLAGFTFVNAQSLEIRDTTGAVMNGTTIEYYGNASDFELKSEYLNVYNTSGSNVTVRCKRTEISPVAGTKTALCWTLCSIDYLAGVQPTLVAPGAAQTIVPGDFKSIYVLHYKPEGNGGTSTYRIVFYNVSNPNDSAYFYAEFNATLSVTETNLNKPASINAFPNPATNNVTIDIENFSDKGTIRITDALGVVVKVAEFNSADQVKFQVSDLRSGVYFYTLYSDKKALLTRRLAITR